MRQTGTPGQSRYPAELECSRRRSDRDTFVCDATHASGPPAALEATPKLPAA